MGGMVRVDDFKRLVEKSTELWLLLSGAMILSFLTLQHARIQRALKVFD